MSIDLSVLVGVMGAVLAAATFFIGRTVSHRNDGKEQGTVLTEIGYVKSGIDDIKRKQEKQEEQHIEIVTRLTAVEQSSKQAHKRIDFVESKMGFHRVEDKED